MNDGHRIPATADARLREWARSLHFSPWNWWPAVSVIGRIRDEGPGAAHSTANQSDGGLFMLNAVHGWKIEHDRRCAEVREAYNVMPLRLKLVLEATYLNWPSPRDPRRWEACVTLSGLSSATYFRRRKEMLEWVEDYLCLPVRMDQPSVGSPKVVAR